MRLYEKMWVIKISYLYRLCIYVSLRHKVYTFLCGEHRSVPGLPFPHFPSTAVYCTCPKVICMPKMNPITE